MYWNLYRGQFDRYVKLRPKTSKYLFYVITDRKTLGGLAFLNNVLNVRYFNEMSCWWSSVILTTSCSMSILPVWQQFYSVVIVPHLCIFNKVVWNWLVVYTYIKYFHLIINQLWKQSDIIFIYCAWNVRTEFKAFVFLSIPTCKANLQKINLASMTSERW